jgi:hypothetical protein
MYKVVWIARYRKDMTKQEASDDWATLHGPPMKQVSTARATTTVRSSRSWTSIATSRTKSPALSGRRAKPTMPRSASMASRSAGSATRGSSELPSNQLGGPPRLRMLTNVFDMTQMWGAVLKENVVIAPQLVGA